MNIVYSYLDFQQVSDFTISSFERERHISRRIKEEKKRIREILLSIHKKKGNSLLLTAEERRIFEQLQEYSDREGPKMFQTAADDRRLRFQLGQKDRFLQGLYYSGRYLPLMEKIFRDRGLPIELTRLPFVESSFNLKARSKVGASGIWQFMASTGKFFMHVGDTVDERNDPIRATEGAAQLLQQNYETLHQWPLALTAYNHGRLGMVRAVQQVGSENISKIIDDYKSASFGFASSNFYAEFLAALHISQNPQRYFGEIEMDHPIEYAEFVMTDYVDFTDIATYTRIPMDTLQELNPGLSDYVIESTRLIPAGFVLRIPPQQRDSFLVRYNEIPGHRKFATQRGPTGDLLAIHKKGSTRFIRRAISSSRR